MIVDCAQYQEGRRVQDAPLSVDVAAAICTTEEGFVWMGIVDPTPEELDHYDEFCRDAERLI